MKTLYFLENSSRDTLEVNLGNAKNAFEAFSSLGDTKLEFKTIFNLDQLPVSNLADILLDKNNVIVTFSMYFGVSRDQLFDNLTFFNRKEMSGHCYVCTSGRLLPALERWVTYNYIKHIENCINSNYIISKVDNPNEEYSYVFARILVRDGKFELDYNINFKQLFELQ